MILPYWWIIIFGLMILIFIGWDYTGFKNPRYNLLTRKIEDCKKKGYVWFHEYRHSIQHKKEVFSIYVMFTRFIFLFFGGMYLLTKGIDIYGLLLILPYLFIVGLEIDAHIYAIRKYFKYKQDVRDKE